MRRTIGFLVAGALSFPAGAAAPRVDACGLLTKELVTQVSPNRNKQSLALVLSVPPQPSPLGATGSACEYGGVHLQVDPPGSPAQVEKDLARSGWARVAGIGDAAYYRDNQGMWGELYVRAGGRVVTVQMSIPDDQTAASIQSNAVQLAKAVLPKLERAR